MSIKLKKVYLKFFNGVFKFWFIIVFFWMDELISVLFWLRLFGIVLWLKDIVLVIWMLFDCLMFELDILYVEFLEEVWFWKCLVDSWSVVVFIGCIDCWVLILKLVDLKGMIF